MKDVSSSSSSSHSVGGVGVGVGIGAAVGDATTTTTTTSRSSSSSSSRRQHQHHHHHQHTATTTTCCCSCSNNKIGWWRRCIVFIPLMVLIGERVVGNLGLTSNMMMMANNVVTSSSSLSLSSTTTLESSKLPKHDTQQQQPQQLSQQQELDEKTLFRKWKEKHPDFEQHQQQQQQQQQQQHHHLRPYYPTLDELTMSSSSSTTRRQNQQEHDGHQEEQGSSSSLSSSNINNTTNTIPSNNAKLCPVIPGRIRRHSLPHFVYIENRVNHNNSTTTTTTTTIPRIIHQTSKSRCLTPGLAHSVQQWTPLIEQGGWSYYFHDDEAVDRLLSLDYPEFPHLKLVARHCLSLTTTTTTTTTTTGTTTDGSGSDGGAAAAITAQDDGTIKADLWRYLVLYVYGGIYADLDTHPNYLNFHVNSTIQPDMQGLFVVEQYHILSQYFMAMAPRHPLMYYAIQHALLNLYGLYTHLPHHNNNNNDNDNNNSSNNNIPNNNDDRDEVDEQHVYAPALTGPHVLHRAFRDYRQDAGVHVTPLGRGYKPVWRGTFVGTYNTTITVVGRGEASRDYIIRESIRLNAKRAEYALMGMRHFRDPTSSSSSSSNESTTTIRVRRSCIHAMLPKQQQQQQPLPPPQQQQLQP